VARMTARSAPGSILGATCAGAVALFAPLAAAQTATEVSLADTLYRQARELSAANNFAEACPKFAESYRLDPATGTLLNLASCHESQGKLATAWLEYSDALAVSRRDHRQSRVKFAEERIAAIEPKLSRLTLTLAPDADGTGLELALDGVQIGRAALGVPTPVDPGTHVVEAKARGKKSWQGSVEIGAAADAQTVTIPALESEPVVVPPPPVITPAPAPVVAPVAPVAPPPPRDVAVERPIPISVYVTGGATLALAIAASVTGGIYLDKKSSYDSGGRTNANQSAAQSDHDSLQTLGVANLVLWIGAAAGAGVTGYLYATRPEERASHAVTVHASGWASRDGLGLGAVGEF
jgi:hypothetical protein